jgi:hypothetical protein
MLLSKFIIGFDNFVGPLLVVSTNYLLHVTPNQPRQNLRSTTVFNKFHPLCLPPIRNVPFYILIEKQKIKTKYINAFIFNIYIYLIFI